MSETVQEIMDKNENLVKYERYETHPNKYAVIETGGKQLKVYEGLVLQIEKIQGEAGEKVDFDKVLMVTDKMNSELKIGRPYVDSAKVSAEIVKQGRDKKIRIVKFRRRKHSRKIQGHRQYLTEVKINQIAY